LSPHPRLRWWPLLALLGGCGGEEPDGGFTEGAPPLVPASCEDPERIDDPHGWPTGYVRCADGSIDRVAAVPVDPTVYERNVLDCTSSLYEDDECRVDADCGERSGGRCVQRSSEFVYWCVCNYICSSDDDCAGRVCLSPEVNDTSTRWPVCVSAGCWTGRNCDSGECGVITAQEGGDLYLALDCRSDLDGCRSNAECEERGEGDLCRADEATGWACEAWSSTH
jgi:hypothetical protein